MRQFLVHPRVRKRSQIQVLLPKQDTREEQDHRDGISCRQAGNPVRWRYRWNRRNGRPIYRFGDRAGREAGYVGTLGNYDYDGLVFAFDGKVLIQPFTELPRFDADDVIFRGAVVPAPPENQVADLVFSNFVLAVLECSLADVQEELSQLRRFLKVCAFGYTKDEFPTAVRRGTFMSSWFHKRLKLNNSSP